MVVSTVTVGGIYALATVVALATGIFLWNRREQTAAQPLSVGSVAAAVWAGGLFVSMLPVEGLAVQGIRVMYFGVGVGLAAMFVFALEYTGREQYVNRRLMALLAIHPLLLAAFAVVNPGELFFSGLDPTATIGVTQQWGPAFWIHSAYGYLLVVATSLLIFELLVRSTRALYRGQAVLLAAGVFAPLPLNAVFLSGLVEFDTTPLGFVIMCTCFGAAMVKYRFVDLSPIARRQVIDSVRDGMIVVDTTDRIVDINPAANKMLKTDDLVVGHAVDDVLTLEESKAAYEKLTASLEAHEQTVDLGDVYYHIESTPMYDGRDRHVGWLFLMQDVTAQKRRERELETQIEKLDTFAQIVSHDLRNPISIANGYIDQTRETGNLENLDRVETATARMEEIIDDVLELAREGQAVTEPTTVSLQGVARDAWEHTETNGASLSVETDTVINADPERLTRLFENLFRNAIDHGTNPDESPDALTVALGVTDETTTKAVLYIEDNGVGIPAEKHDSVLKDGYTTNTNGTGFGLAIVARIADAHGWDITVTDSDRGGARFEISGVSKPWGPSSTTSGSSGSRDEVSRHCQTQSGR